MVVDKLDTTFAALSDPTRRAMIERLSHGPASVHGLTEPFALSQQMISKHIAYLVRARIVIKTKRGRECRQVGCGCESNEKNGGQRWQKTRLTRQSGWLSLEYLMPHAHWFGRRG